MSETVQLDPPTPREMRNAMGSFATGVTVVTGYADGEPVGFTGDGLLARCLQHETDHLRGTVFGDRLPTKLRKKLQKQHDRAAEEFPEGWPA